MASEIQAPAEETVRRPKMKLLGHDGNIFSIMGDARRLLVRNGQSKEADEMFQRVQDSGNYYQALGLSVICGNGIECAKTGEGKAA